MAIINIKLIIFSLPVNPLISLNNYNIEYVKLGIIIIIVNIMLTVLSSLTQKILLIIIINITLIN